MNRPQSRRSAQFGNRSASAQRLDCGCFSAAIVRQWRQPDRETSETFIAAAASGRATMNFKPAVFGALTLGLVAQTFATVFGAESRKLVDAPGSGPIWSRHYEIGTDRPIFGDRDKTIHDDVNEISRERRQGYGWFRDAPKRVLDHYAKWAELHPMR